VCAVCGRTLCSLTKGGMIHAHKRYDDRPSINQIMAALQSAQDLLGEALRAVERIESDQLCTMNADCPNR
jgi:hypothetical protein